MKTLKECRVCGSANLVEVLSLGNQPLSGVFPKSAEQAITVGPLRLVHCAQCELVQLGESFPHDEMYGDNYGYRSGLNSSMVEHLENIARGLQRRLALDSGTVVCDIGSNDSTFLNFFLNTGAKLVGIDPTISKHAALYDPRIIKVPTLFSADAYESTGLSKANLITSIAMFYDLENPIVFAREINESLVNGGMWFFEQSYAPWMLNSGAYDTICHEHLEYYSLTSINNILSMSGFYISEVSTNSINGGSISVLAIKGERRDSQSSEYAEWLLSQEQKTGVNSLESWRLFGARVLQRRESLNDLIKQISSSGKSIYALGASTKGNVLLNYSKITNGEIPLIGEVNADKWGYLTPGSHIPIVDEKEILALNPDYLLFLPWHFREFAINKYSDYLRRGGKFIFPLPSVEVIGY